MRESNTESVVLRSRPAEASATGKSVPGPERTDARSLKLWMRLCQTPRLPALAFEKEGPVSRHKGAAVFHLYFLLLDEWYMPIRKKIRNS